MTQRQPAPRPVPPTRRPTTTAPAAKPALTPNPKPAAVPPWPAGEVMLHLTAAKPSPGWKEALAEKQIRKPTAPVFPPSYIVEAQRVGLWEDVDDKPVRIGFRVMVTDFHGNRFLHLTDGEPTILDADAADALAKKALAARQINRDLWEVTYPKFGSRADLERFDASQKAGTK